MDTLPASGGVFFVQYSLVFVVFVSVSKGAWWMPWHREPMKDVGGCDMPRGAVNRAWIRGFPNGETQHE